MHKLHKKTGKIRPCTLGYYATCPYDRECRHHGKPDAVDALRQRVPIIPSMPPQNRERVRELSPHLTAP
jgi:hypothetical protein